MNVYERRANPQTFGVEGHTTVPIAVQKLGENKFRHLAKGTQCDMNRRGSCIIDMKIT